MQKHAHYWKKVGFRGAHSRKPQQTWGGFQGSRITNASVLSQEDAQTNLQNYLLCFTLEWHWFDSSSTKKRRYNSIVAIVGPIINRQQKFQRLVPGCYICTDADSCKPATCSWISTEIHQKQSASSTDCRWFHSICITERTTTPTTEASDHQMISNLRCQSSTCEIDPGLPQPRRTSTRFNKTPVARACTTVVPANLFVQTWTTAFFLGPPPTGCRLPLARKNSSFLTARVCCVACRILTVLRGMSHTDSKCDKCTYGTWRTLRFD